MRRLYDIESDIAGLFEKYVDEETGEVKEGFEQAMEGLEKERDAKIEGVGLMLKETRKRRLLLTQRSSQQRGKSKG